MSAMLEDRTIRVQDRLATKARAIAVILLEEFETAFSVYDAESGYEIGAADPGTTSRSGHALQVWPEVVRQAAQEGRCRVADLGEARYKLTLVLYDNNRPQLVAYGIVPGLAAAAGKEQEQRRLQKWVEAVSTRLCLADQVAHARRDNDEQAAQLKRAWELLLNVGAVVRHLRLHKEPYKNRGSVLRAVRQLLDVQTLLWVPDAVSEPVMIEGDLRLAPDDCRYLAAQVAAKSERQAGRPEIWNADQMQALAHRVPGVTNLLAFPLTERAEGGWLIAVNKRAPADARGRPAAGDKRADFRRADAAAMSPFAALFELLLRSTRRFQDLRELLVGLTRALTSALDAKDAYTFGHSERVARIAVELGQEMRLTEDELSDIYLAGLLHDIGKIGVPDAILAKSGPLTEDEFNVIKQHVVIGHRILADLKPLNNLLPGVLYHHERYDGKGYPEGLAGTEIPSLARILAVADAYDAMSTKRAYRTARPVKEIEDTLQQGAGTQWDAAVVEAFFRCRERIHQIRQSGVGLSLCQAIDGALRSSDSSRLHQTNWVTL